MDTEILAELVRQKRECLQQLVELVRRQQSLIEAEEMAHLLDLLAAKQRLVVELEGIERKLHPFRKQKAHERQWASDRQRARCADDLETIKRLLDEILQRETQSEADLSRRRDQAHDQLEGTHRAQDARQAYLAGEDLNQVDFSS
jgi:hypothetical protein